MSVSQLQLYLWEIVAGDANPLKQFLAWRRHHRSNGRFAYAHPETTLHRDLELRDNLLLALGESAQGMALLDKEQLVRKVLEREHLTALVHWPSASHTYASTLTTQQRAMASICHALVQRADQTLLDLRGVELTEFGLGQVKQVVRARSGLVVIATHDASPWRDLGACAFDTASASLKKSA